MQATASALPQRHHRRIRFFAVPAFVLVVAALSTGAAAAAPPQRDVSGPGGAAGGGQDRGGPSKATRGYDISYPQCGSPYPANPLFAIVGINGGKVFSGNPCLASQLAWGGDAAAELYVNTGNP